MNKGQNAKNFGKNLKPKILKSKRYRKRYLLAAYPATVSANNAFRLLLGEFQKVFGRQGCLDRKISILECSNGKAIVRCANKALSEVKTALNGIKGFVLKKASGTIKTLNR